MEAAETRLVNITAPHEHMSDRQGLNRAYGTRNGVFYNNGTMYVSGTRTVKNALDWWPLVPRNRVHHSSIYKTAKTVLSLYPETQRVVGHSFGALVSQDLAEKRDIDYLGYGVPQFTLPHSEPERMNRVIATIANLGDPVSSLDFNAFHRFPYHMTNPHGY